MDDLIPPRSIFSSSAHLALLSVLAFPFPCLHHPLSLSGFCRHSHNSCWPAESDSAPLHCPAGQPTRSRSNTRFPVAAACGGGHPHLWSPHPLVLDQLHFAVSTPLPSDQTVLFHPRRAIAPNERLVTASVECIVRRLSVAVTRFFPPPAFSATRPPEQVAQPTSRPWTDHCRNRPPTRDRTAPLRNPTTTML